MNYIQGFIIVLVVILIGIQLYMFETQSRYKAVADESISKLSQDKYSLANQNYEMAINWTKTNNQLKQTEEELVKLKQLAFDLQEENNELRKKQDLPPRETTQVVAEVPNDNNDKPTPTPTPPLPSLPKTGSSKVPYGVGSRVKVTEENFERIPGTHQVLWRRKLEYPPFVIPLPSFPAGTRQSDVQLLVQQSEVAKLHNAMKDCVRNKAEVCKGLSADTHVAFFDSEVYLTGEITRVQKGNLICSEDDCGGYCGWQAQSRSKYWLHPQNRSDAAGKPTKYIPEAMLMMTHSGWAFQHWLPDVMPKIAQAWDVLQNMDMKILSDPMQPSRSPMVPYMWDYLGWRDRIFEMPRGYTSYNFDELTHNCIAPAVHPILWQETQNILGIKQSSYTERKYIVWMSRKKGAYNGGRRIVNEDECFEKLSAWAKTIGAEAVLFDHTMHNSAKEAIEFFNQAKMILGPHGGAMFNLIFSPRDTVVVEFFPKSLYGNIGGPFVVWYQSAMLEQSYWRIHSEATGSDMTVDIKELLDILTQEDTRLKKQ